MPWDCNDHEYRNVLGLDARGRYEYFIHKVADWQEVWGLRRQAGWVTFGHPDGGEGFPFWPHPRYAEACATGDWSDHLPESIPLDAFVERWLPGMAADGLKVAVFPVPETNNAAVLAPETLKADLEEELLKYEGEV
ncbi:MAG: DUF2750 domain-containing protein [Armatimonadota bacterium]